MRAMIDTQVLSHAIAEPGGTPAQQAMQQDCRILVEQMDEVSVSIVVLFELLRAPPAVVERLKKSGLLDLLRVEALDIASGTEAARLLEVARTKPHLCKRCFNVRGATACADCGQLVSHQQKANDAFIVATAATLKDVDVLYSIDGGVLELGKYTSMVRVERPPCGSGPLFVGLPPPSTNTD